MGYQEKYVRTQEGVLGRGINHVGYQEGHPLSRPAGRALFRWGSHQQPLTNRGKKYIEMMMDNENDDEILNHL